MHIAIEGLDGVGKTTTAMNLALDLDGVYFSKGFHLMRDTSGKYDNFTTLNELSLYRNGVYSKYGCRSSFIYAKATHLNVVTERYYCTNYAVKPTEETLRSIRFSMEAIGIPDLTCILYCDYRTNYDRMYKRNPNDKDFPKLETQKIFYENMVNCAQMLNLPYIFIDTSNLTIEEVVKKIKDEINKNCNSTSSIYTEDDFDIRGHELSVRSGVKNIFRLPTLNADINKINIPSSVESIAWNVFDQLPSLEFIEVNKSNQKYLSAEGVLFDKTGAVLLRMPPCYNNMTYSIPDQVEVIHHFAFKDCKLNDVIFNSLCKEIGYMTFLNCKNLKNIILNKALSQIGTNAFNGCNQLKFTVDENPDFYSENETFLCDKESIIFGSELPVTFHVKNVRKIKAWAFSSDESVQTVYCSESVERLGPYSFARSSIRHIKFESIVEIGDYSFWDCFNLQTITFTNLCPPKLGYDIFYRIKNKIQIFVPKVSLELYKACFSRYADVVVVRGENDDRERI